MSAPGYRLLHNKTQIGLNSYNNRDNTLTSIHYFYIIFKSSHFARLTLRPVSNGDIFEIDLPSSSLKISLKFLAPTKQHAVLLIHALRQSFPPLSRCVWTSIDLPVDVDDEADDEDQHQYADCSSNQRRVTSYTQRTNNDKKVHIKLPI